MTNNIIINENRPSLIYNMPETSIHSLPGEMLIYIFSLLSSPETVKCSLVCKHWEQLLQEPSLWNHFIRRDCSWLVKNAQVEDPKSVYQNHYLINTNMINNTYRKTTIQTPDIFPNIISSLIPMQEDMLISVTNQGTFRIWDLDAKECRYAFKIDNVTRHNRISCVHITPQNQLTFIFNNQLMIRSLHQEDSATPFNEQVTNIVQLFSNEENQLVTISQSAEIKIWDLQNKACVKTIQLSTDMISAFFCMPKRREYVSINCMPASSEVKLWDQEGLCSKTHVLSLNQITAFACDEDNKRLISAADNKIQIWDLNTGNCLSTFEQFYVSFLNLIDPTKLLASSRCGEIALWDMTTGTPLNSLKNMLPEYSELQPTQIAQAQLTYGIISSIAAPRGNIVFSTCRNSIEFWDFRKIFSNHPNKKTRTHE